METTRILSCGKFYLNYHQYHAHGHPFPYGMNSNYCIHSSMSLLFLPFISMLIPRAYELEIVSAEERRTREKGKDDKLGEEFPTMGRATPNFTQIHPHVAICIHAQRKSTGIQQ
jgi:hypothetical protein